LCKADQGWENCEGMISFCLSPEMVADRIRKNEETKKLIESALKTQEGIDFSFDIC
jgi:hypothetical protein